MNKRDILAAILDELREGFEWRQSTSKRTRAAGNDAESKAESKYDTLSIEENYLADGLAKKAREAAEAAAELELLPLRDFAPDEPADLGALIEVAFSDGVQWFFLAPAGGGTEITHDGHSITVVTTASPVGSQLSGLTVGSTLSRPPARILRIL